MKILVHGDSGKTFFKFDENRSAYFADLFHSSPNIDNLRFSYCELTALYYVLHNSNDPIVGIEQYRRYLMNEEGTAPIGLQEVSDALKDYDVICGVNYYFPGNTCGDCIYAWPKAHGLEPYFEEYLNVIQRMYGDSMYLHFRNYLNGKVHCHGNLMIGKRHVLQDYLDFLMKTCDELANHINIMTAPRLVEYLSEFLFGAWLTYNNKRIYWAPFFNCNFVERRGLEIFKSKDSNMKIYVVGNSKNKFLPLNSIREKFFIDQPHDGSNIDFLNPWYCELTALYYMWNNVNDDIVGLEHYRRYFVNDKDNLLSENEINEILKDNDVICKKWIFAEHNETNIYNCWKYGSGLETLQLFINCIEDEGFKKFIDEKIKTQPFFYQCNMFIGKKKIIDEYAEWLFYTLSKLDKKDFISKPRICGYYAEYFFGLWLQYKGYKIKDVKVNVFDKTLSRQVVK